MALGGWRLHTHRQGRTSRRHGIALYTDVCRLHGGLSGLQFSSFVLYSLHYGLRQDSGKLRHQLVYTIIWLIFRITPFALGLGYLGWILAGHGGLITMGLSHIHLFGIRFLREFPVNIEGDRVYSRLFTICFFFFRLLVIRCVHRKFLFGWILVRPAFCDVWMGCPKESTLLF